MSEYEPRPVPQTDDPDLRRLEVASRRFDTLIAEGLSAAHEEHREIDNGTARCIAHVLGRALGRGSALAEFGRTGEGDYLTLREEYLHLYNDPGAPDDVKRWIDWFGTFLVQRENIGSDRRFMNEHEPPSLDRILVRTDLQMTSGEQRAYVPAQLSAREIVELAAQLEAFDEYQASAFRAFLMLSDVNAADPNLIESFRESHVGSWTNIEDAVREMAELDGLEDELQHLTNSRGLPEAAVAVDYDVLEDHVREAFDIVSEGWQVHVFSK